MDRIVIALLAAVVLCVTASDARANDAGVPTNPLEYAEEVRAPVHFEYESLLIAGICDVNYDSGWVPADSPIQVRFEFAIHCGYKIELDGDAVGSWPPRPGPYLSFRGRPLGGRYEMAFTVDFDLSARLDFVLPDGTQVSEEIDIPFIPDIHMGLYDAKRFTPFLLQGNPERPVVIQDDIPYTQLLEVDLLDLVALAMGTPPQDIISIPLRLMMSGYAGSRFEGRRIVVDQDQWDGEQEPPPPLEFLEENEKLWLPVHPAEGTAWKRATYEGAVTHFASISFFPEIAVEILNQQIIGFPLFEVPIDFPDTNEYWEFDPVSFGLPLPNIGTAGRMVVGSADVGSETEKLLAIQNIGDWVLRGEAYVDPPFFLPYPPRFEIDPMTGVQLPVMFRPTNEGPFEGNLVIYSNDPNESPKVVRLEAVGCRPGGACVVPDDTLYICEYDRKCGCQASGPGAPLGTLLLGLLAFVAIRRRRRR